MFRKDEKQRKYITGKSTYLLITHLSFLSSNFFLEFGCFVRKKLIKQHQENAETGPRNNIS